MTEQKTYFYRYIESGSADSESSLEFNSVTLFLELLEVVKKTPCGTWITHGYTGAKNKFVLDHSIKKYAHPTKEAAYKSFLARKKKQLKIYKDKIATIQVAMTLDREKADICAPPSYWEEK